VDENVGPRRIEGLSEIADDYRGLLCDVWGVLHNGVEAYRPAIEALCRFRETGGRVVLITNAPRPARQVREQLRRLGARDAAYDSVITSGDVTRNLLGARAGASMFHLGPEQDRPIFEGLDLSLRGWEEAEFVLLTGLFDDETETPEDYEDLLAQLRARNLEVICANPDVVVERGSRRVYCAGALAQSYEALGGRVIYSGKPYLPIYDAALSLFAELSGEPMPKRKILAVGDGVRTDLKGAVAAGLDMLFITSGIHSEQGATPASLQKLFAEAGVRPCAVLKALVW
jgi:HAD superfamily hydrolase (TIGR01459 family)